MTNYDKHLYIKSDLDCDNNLIICDNTGFGINGFRKETEIDVERYKLSQVILFTVLIHHHSAGDKVIYLKTEYFDTETIEKYKYNYSALILKKEIPIKIDGYYSLYCFAIPTQIYITKQNNYLADISGNIYNESGEEITLNDIEFCNSNIMYFNRDFFSTGNLRKTFLNNVHNGIFKNKGGILDRIKGRCCESTTTLDINSSVIGSALAAIRYLLEECKYKESELIVEQLSGCADIYINNNNIQLSNNSGCGCK